MRASRPGGIAAGLLAVWVIFLLLTVAPAWLPNVAMLRNLVTSLQRGTPEAGMVYALHHHLEMIGKTLVLHAVLVGAGAGVAAWLAPTGFAGGLAAWAVGFGAISLFTLGWGLTGLMFPGPVLAGVAGLGLAGWWRSVPRGWAAARWAGRPRPQGFDAVLAGTCGAAIGLMLAVGIAPDTSWDAVVYHLRVPSFFIQEHKIFHMPTHHFASFPLAAEMLNACLMLWGGLDRMGGGEAPKLFHLSCAVIAAGCARRLAGRYAGPTSGWVAAAVILLSPFTGTIGVRTYNDFVQAALFGAVLLLWLEAARGGLRLAGTVCGVALSAKYSAVLAVVPLAILWFRLRWVPYALAGAVLVAWSAKNWLLTGNPAAPFLTRMFPAATETQTQFAGYAGSMGHMSFSPGLMGQALWGVLEGRAGESLTELVAILLGAAVLLPGAGRVPRRLAIFAAVFTALWVEMTPDLRFYTPGLVALAAIAGAAWTGFEALSLRWSRIVMGGLLVLNLTRLPIAHIGLFDPLPFTLGRETAWDHAARSLYPAPFYGRIADWINQELPPRARLLVLIDIKAHYIWRRVYHDFQYVQPGLYLRWLRAGGDTVPGLLKKLRQEGVTHLLIIRQRTRDVGNHYAWEGGELADTAEFLASYTRSVARTDAVEVLRILPAPQPRRPLDDYGWILFTRAENLLIAGEDDEALALLETTVHRAPWLRDAKAFYGMALARHQRLGEAERVLTAAVQEGGAHASTASFVLGQIRRYHHDLPGAERAWRTALRLNAASGEAHYNLGLLLWETKRTREALAELNAAVAADPSNEGWSKARAELAGKLGAP